MESWALTGSAVARFCLVWIVGEGKYNATELFRSVEGVRRLASHAHMKTTAPLSTLLARKVHPMYRDNSL